MTGATANLDVYFRSMAEEGLFRSERNLRFYQNGLFRGIDFAGKDVLDVGAGTGLNGFYAACGGARRVICLEPAANGSTAGVHGKFQQLKRRLGTANIQMEPDYFQSFDFSGLSFDIILLHNSINHLDEPACVDLLRSRQALYRYRKIFDCLAAIARPGAKLIVCDCSRYNLFALLGTRNPFMPTIEWEKHQSPEVWARLLEEAGFENPKIRWSSFNRLGTPGRWLLGNKPMAWMLKSHFWLTMDKRRAPPAEAREGRRAEGSRPIH